ncbi:MAG TPA: hypothetical protein PKX92_10115 [Edaphocola sp.]|nr:hypothetical protein [Edaphocola sp.]
MKKYFIIFILLSVAPIVKGQNVSQNLITADSLQSGNYKDVFSSFFQFAFNNLAGAQKAFNFQSNPFAIMLKGNKDLEVDTNWYKYRRLRNFNFLVGLNIDSSFKIKGFNFGLNYALINQRDLTVSKMFLLQIDSLKGTQLVNKIGETLEKIRGTIPIEQKEFKTKFRNEVDDLINAKENTSFNSLSDDVKAYIMAHVQESEMPELLTLIKQNGNANFQDLFYSEIENLRQEFLMKPLWTVGLIGVSEGNNFSFQSIAINSKFLMGLGNFQTPHRITYELESDAKLKMGRDSLNVFEEGLVRKDFDLGVHLNAVFRPDRKTSITELKLGISYKNIFSGKYDFESSQSFNINTEWRFKVYDDFWVPLLFSYDLEQNKYFLGLNLSYNFIDFFKRNKLGK